MTEQPGAEQPGTEQSGTEQSGTEQPGTEQPSLLRSSAVMAIGTLVSRLTGFLRSLVLVWALGTVLFADSFNLANTIPTSLYVLVAGGALNAVFVPQLVRAMRNDADGGEAFGQRLITLVALVLLGVTIISVIAAPWVVRAYANTELLAPRNHAYFEVAVTLARYCLPQILFYGLFVLFGQVLNARGRFGPMMWAPILNNLISIAVFATFIVVADGITPGEVTSGQRALLGIGTTAGIVAQALCLIPVLRRAGFRLRPRLDLRGAGLGKSGKLAMWTLGFVLINQAWFLTATRLTTGVGAQAHAELGNDVGYGLTPYLNAYLILMLPHAVIAVSIVTALLPRMSRSAAAGAIEEVRGDLAHGLRLVVVAIMPAAAAMFVLGPDLTVGLFAHSDHVSVESARVMGFILMGFAPGLIGFCSHYVTLRGFYAYENTRTPMFVQAVVVCVAIVLAVTAYATLPIAWKTVGIAAAYATGYWAGFSVNLTLLRRRLGRIHGGELGRTYLRALVAVAIPAAAAYAVDRGLVSVLGPGSWSALLAVLVAGVVLVLGYVLLARRLRIDEIAEVIDLVAARLLPRGSGRHR